MTHRPRSHGFMSSLHHYVTISSGFHHTFQGILLLMFIWLIEKCGFSKTCVENTNVCYFPWGIVVTQQSKIHCQHILKQIDPAKKHIASGKIMNFAIRASGPEKILKIATPKSWGGWRAGWWFFARKNNFLFCVHMPTEQQDRIAVATLVTWTWVLYGLASAS